MPVQTLRALTDDAGFDDVFVYAAVPSVVEMADELLAEDGCLNFFAGPTDKNFKVPFNFLQRPLQQYAHCRHVWRFHGRHERGDCP